MTYYVYIIASRKDGAIYIGVTNDIVRRIYEHRIKAVPGFASKYNITRLVWFEIYDDPVSAISREKELKKWKRSWKTKLIEAQNPEWEDLYESICSRSGAMRSIEPGISRFRVRVFDAPRNDVKLTPSPLSTAVLPPPSPRR